MDKITSNTRFVNHHVCLQREKRLNAVAVFVS